MKRKSTFVVFAGMAIASMLAIGQVQAQVPSLTAKLASQSLGLNSANESVQFTNSSTVSATNVRITSITARVLGGTGSVTLKSPSLPYAIGTIAANSSVQALFTMNVPTTVSRFSLVENGTLQDNSGHTYNFSLSQLALVTWPTANVSPSSLTFGTVAVRTTSAPQLAYLT
jgi:hypothetical protein